LEILLCARGLTFATPWCMPTADDFRELDCWQLAKELKFKIYAITRREHIKRDFKFVDQIRDAASSATRNIAEGFGRRTDPDFAHFLDIARASLYECQDLLEDGVDRGYIDKPECAPLVVLAKRAGGAVAALQRYLRGTDGEGTVG
jgi:four helix bundle protein